MKLYIVISAALAAAMPLSWKGGFAPGSAQDRDRDQIKTQQQLQDQDR